MTSLKTDSKLNKEVEECVQDIKDLDYSNQVKYKAARRFNDRIYEAKRKKATKTTKKKTTKKNVKKIGN